MNHIKAHNVGFLSESWNIKPINEEHNEELDLYIKAINNFEEACSGNTMEKEEFDRNEAKVWNNIAHSFKSLYYSIDDQELKDRLNSIHKSLYAQLYFIKFPNAGQPDDDPSTRPVISLYQNKNLLDKLEQTKQTFQRLLGEKQ